MVSTTQLGTGRLTIGYDEAYTKEKRYTDGRQDLMERFWSNSIFKYLRVEPEDHHFLLTEPVRCASTTIRKTTLTAHSH